MRVEYNEAQTVAYFNGIKFRRDPKTGYFLATRKTDGKRRERLHCYVWRYYHGAVPEGFHVHHKDENKLHNDIENLECISRHDHLSLHSTELASQNQEQLSEHLNRVRWKATEWHRSEEGRAWHRDNGKRVAAQMEAQEYICQYCGRSYTTLPFGTSKFCSAKCRAADRRKRGVDNETRTCVICGKEFTANKYSKNRCCSRACGGALHSRSVDQKRRAAAGV